MIKINTNLKPKSFKPVFYKSTVSILGRKSTKKSFEKKLSIFPSVWICNLLTSSPVFAEAGKIFDFNATLPVMAVQFILLMIFLDKNWFGPVGKVLDERNKKVNTMLSSFKDGNEELEALQTEAESILRDARTEAKTKISEAKADLSQKAEAKLLAQKAKLSNELTIGIKKLEDERDSAQKELDVQVGELSKYILERVLPTGFSL